MPVETFKQELERLETLREENTLQVAYLNMLALPRAQPARERLIVVVWSL